MNTTETENRDKLRKDRAKQAIALAMRSMWEDAVVVNRSILKEFPKDLEAFNRLGKALSELGRNREAKEAFQRALELSPYNSIAKKNLDRLERLGDVAPTTTVRGSVDPDVFIEESGKTGVTSLVNVAPANVLLKLAPGRALKPQIENGNLNVVESSGIYIGQVEPKLASRLVRLMKGGNQYDATVTSVSELGLTIIIRETFKHPSQIGTVSFPSRGGASHRIFTPSAVLGEDETDEKEPVVVKDWSDDDTEPGDDEAFTPVFHRIIKAGEQSLNEDDGDI